MKENLKGYPLFGVQIVTDSNAHACSTVLYINSYLLSFTHFTSLIAGYDLNCTSMCFSDQQFEEEEQQQQTKLMVGTLMVTT